MNLWIIYSPRLRWIHPAFFHHWLRSLEISPAALLAAYRKDRPRGTRGDRTMSILGDVLFQLPQVRLAEAQCGHRSDTKMYLFAWKSPVRDGQLGAPHAVDVPFFSGNLDASGAVELTGPGPERYALSGVIQDAWIAFARTGDPHHDALPDWPPYEPSRRTTLVFDTVSRTRDDPSGAIRQLWDHLPFDGLRPTGGEMPKIGDITIFYRKRWRVLIASSSALLVALLALISWLCWKA